MHKQIDYNKVLHMLMINVTTKYVYAIYTCVYLANGDHFEEDAIGLVKGPGLNAILHIVVGETEVEAWGHTHIWVI